MIPFRPPVILNDASRLDEIFHLRIKAWENSPGGNQINSQKYPEGYQDVLDKKSLHFIATNYQDEIIGAARLSICKSVYDLPYPETFNDFRKIIPANKTFLFYSRLVIRPDFRKRGLARDFDIIRLQKHRELQLPFGLVTVNPKRSKQVSEFGFQLLGETESEASDSPFDPLNLMVVYLSKMKLPELNTSDKKAINHEELIYG